MTTASRAHDAGAAGLPAAALLDEARGKTWSAREPRKALQPSRKEPKLADVKLSTLRGVRDGQSTVRRRRSGYAADSGVVRHGFRLERCWQFCDFPSRFVDALALGGPSAAKWCAAGDD
jgi:hypothetical protein